MEFVDVHAAREAPGLRLVVVAGIPSPWSEAAKGIFHVKRVPFVATRLAPGDKSVFEWTGVRNAPVAVFDKELPRSGWAGILELAERLAPTPALVPSGAEDRTRMFGLAHEIMGEGGLLWSGRLLTMAASFESDGARGFPIIVANYLARRYGYAPDAVTRARARAKEALVTLGDALVRRRSPSPSAAGGPYFFGDALSALDIYSAAAMNILVPLPDDQCPMLPPLRAAFESMIDELSADLAPELLQHRTMMYERHLELPIAL